MYTKDKVPWSRETWEEDFPGGVHKQDGGPPARDILYRDVAKWYRWSPGNQKKNKIATWEKRKRNDHNTVGRVRHITPSVDRKELFYFRLMLNTKPGPT